MAKLSQFISTPSPARQSSNPLYYNLDDIKDHFDREMSTCKDISNIVNKGLNPNQIDTAKALWKAQIMLTCSSLDYYLRRYYYYALYSMYTEKWARTVKFTNDVLTPLLPKLQKKSPDKANMFFLDSIRKKHKQDSFFSYVMIQNIADMCGFTFKKILKSTFRNSSSQNSIFTQLSDMIDQRNRLMHSENIDLNKDIPEYLGGSTVKQFMEAASNLVNTLYDLGIAKET